MILVMLFGELGVKNLVRGTPSRSSTVLARKDISMINMKCELALHPVAA